MRTRKINPETVRTYADQVVNGGGITEEPWKFSAGRGGRRGAFRDRVGQALRSSGGETFISPDILNPEPTNLERLLGTVVLSASE